MSTEAFSSVSTERGVGQVSAYVSMRQHTSAYVSIRCWASVFDTFPHVLQLHYAHCCLFTAASLLLPLYYCLFTTEIALGRRSSSAVFGSVFRQPLLLTTATLLLPLLLLPLLLQRVCRGALLLTTASFLLPLLLQRVYRVSAAATRCSGVFLTAARTASCRNPCPGRAGALGRPSTGTK